MYFRTRVQIPAPPFLTSLGWGPLASPPSLRARGRLRRLPSGPRLRPQALLIATSQFLPASSQHGGLSSVCSRLLLTRSAPQRSRSVRATALRPSLAAAGAADCDISVPPSFISARRTLK